MIRVFRAYLRFSNQGAKGSFQFKAPYSPQAKRAGQSSDPKTLKIIKLNRKKESDFGLTPTKPVYEKDEHLSKT